MVAPLSKYVLLLASASRLPPRRRGQTEFVAIPSAPLPPVPHSLVTAEPETNKKYVSRPSF